MEIKVLGSGCANCQRLEQLVFDVLAENDITASVLKVTDVKEIISYGAMSTPALVINGKLKLAGMVPSKNKLKELFLAEQA